MPESSARGRINWGVLGVEAAAIFFSVLLGFAVTEWRQARADARAVEHALSAYAEEIAINQRSVAQSFSYHRDVYRRLAQFQPSLDAPLFESLREVGWQGPRQVTFRDAARATAEATDVLGLLPFDTASELVMLYNAQDRLDETESSFAEAAFNPAILDGESPRGAVMAIGVYFNMVVEREAGLLEGYRQVVGALGLDIEAAADTLDLTF